MQFELGVLVTILLALWVWRWLRRPPAPCALPFPVPANKRKRVAIIGCGPAGLTMVKELTEAGHEAVAFEMQPTLGGVFASTYDECQLTTSSNNTMYSFPHGKEDKPIIWTTAEYVDYLNKYAGHYKCFSKIYFNSQVSNAEYNQATRTWTVQAGPVPESKRKLGRATPPCSPQIHPDGQTFTADHLVVCCGLNSQAKQQSWPGQETFLGEIKHTVELSSAAYYKGKRVLVVGLGESGSDLCLHVAKVAAASAVSSRAGPGYIIPRYVNGTVTDLDTNRVYHSYPRWLGRHWSIKFKNWLEDLYLVPEDDLKVLGKAGAMNRARGFHAFQRFGTKNISFVEAMVYHGLEYHPDIQEIKPDRVVFVDGSEFVCDLILNCTGFKPDFFFLKDKSIVEECCNFRENFYKRMIIPRMGDSMCFVGFARPGIGAIPVVAEMQARYFALLVSGLRTLPDAAAMREDIMFHKHADEFQYPVDHRRLHALTDYLRYLDSLARSIGCSPPLFKLFFTDPKIWFACLFRPICASQFRLVGPGADPATAAYVLLRMPNMPLLVLAWEFTLAVFFKSIYLVTRRKEWKPTGF